MRLRKYPTPTQIFKRIMLNVYIGGPSCRCSLYQGGILDNLSMGGHYPGNVSLGFTVDTPMYYKFAPLRGALDNTTKV